MRNLNAVCMIETILPCVAYALRRSGRNKMLNTFMAADFIKKIKKYNKEVKLEQGDLVLWEFDMDYEYHPTEINEQGRITSQALHFPYHVAVYEGDDRVSDLILDDTSRHLPMHIRMRVFSELTDPSHYLR